MFIFSTSLLTIILAVNCQQQGGYTLEQALSRDAQFKTLSFDGLSFITGNLCADSFIPPGKVSDYFGFQYLRDNTPNGQGHNTDFLTFLANNVFDILNTEQITILTDRAKDEVEIVNEYAQQRYPLMKAFRLQLEGNTPNNNELNQDKVMEWSANTLYSELDAEISINRAFTFSKVIKSLSNDQLLAFNEMDYTNGFPWNSMQETEALDKREFSNDEFILIMTYVSEMYAWFAGNITSDTYFCPERQANYFGSFYVKDAPAVGTKNYTIPEEMTADKGQIFAENILNDEQYNKLYNLVLIQENDLYNIAESREAIATELRKYLQNDNNDMYDINIDFIYGESAMYGKYDGNISYHYTMTFTDIKNELTDEQLVNMSELRGLTDEYVCPDDKIYKYSTRIDMPIIENVDYFFNDDEFVDIFSTYAPMFSSTIDYFDMSTSEMCQVILEFEGGSDSSSFLNNLEWIKINNDDDGDYYFVSQSDEYYLYRFNNCFGDNASWWIINNDMTHSDKPICNEAIGRCKEFDILNCDGKWEFKDVSRHIENTEVRILSMDDGC
eukprot:499889_1